MPKAPAPAPLPAPQPLTYVGDGAYLPDVPARDLTADEVAALAISGVADVAALLASGLYAPVAISAPVPPET